MDRPAPLSAQLSQALVAFTIEFDNEFEHQMPHRTTDHGATPGSGRDSLAAVVGDGTAEGSPLFVGLQPYPDGWRSQAGPLKTLPHYPMVSHRGGFRDGS